LSDFDKLRAHDDETPMNEAPELFYGSSDQFMCERLISVVGRLGDDLRANFPR